MTSAISQALHPHLVAIFLYHLVDCLALVSAVCMVAVILDCDGELCVLGRGVDFPADAVIF